MFKFRSNFSDLLDKLPNSTKFLNAVTRDALKTTKEREQKFHLDDLREVKKNMLTSMRDTLKTTKAISVATTKGHIENKAMIKAYSNA